MAANSARIECDDTIPLTCSIEKANIIDSHVEYVLIVQRGSNPENFWKVQRRYNDFVTLHAALQISGRDLPLPPKKLFGNLDKDFVAKRKQQLQVYVNVILEDPFLSHCLTVKKFFDPTRYTIDFYDIALRNVSMFFRSDQTWDIVESLRSIGWRLRKNYFLVKSKQDIKASKMLSWADIGHLSKISNKDRQSVLKLLPTMQHPYIQSVLLADSNDLGGVIIRNFSMQGSLRDYICKTKIKQHYIKKYANPKLYHALPLPEIKTFGRQILEALKFLQSRGWPYGHLHTGNVLLEGNVCKFIIRYGKYTPRIAIVLSKLYRYDKENTGKTKENEDSYCFGRVLYEMAFGEQLTTAALEAVPARCIPAVAPILESLISTSALKSALPSINDILKMTLFCDVILTAGIEKPTLKIPSKLKEVLRTIHEHSELKLREEQKILSQFKRFSKVQAQQPSIEERKKKRKNGKAKKPQSDASDNQRDQPNTSYVEEVKAKPSEAIDDANLIPTSESQDSEQISSPSANVVPAQSAIQSNAGLLSSITSFKKSILNPTNTNDRSAPKL
ncbi:PX domain-containing protein kinase-like protein [Trichoplax sp. H2]|nr:PX domain-containing protein kinase-like protein [Trichoplax sp. H2]|eukprot:RDD47204.1 PX domain-containing protein kinase-like protein [Trichoplax sp. H2]